MVSFLHTVLLCDKLDFSTALVVCPLNTALNWMNEFEKWQEGLKDNEKLEVSYFKGFLLLKQLHEIDIIKEKDCKLPMMHISMGVFNIHTFLKGTFTNLYFPTIGL